ncbi:hypothetical protein HWD03_gp097 [Alteromonas phage vB_AmeM_PT11-V22]|uniref:Lipoprotein n=1 Tax=Alteromonas phage vB_AmeM_PT11-V22 TaxID=2704031 RepID=A0A6C0R0T2_9CAUD|nr:hypothetical protein HWD03_gp097 [Alteromonas phage vB_AmeM_PT11-V22]QHZ59778.1 hypothetical protein [Alteromonas phage vB_AmeM_PT11-V22]
MKRLILTLGLALFLTGCVEEKVVYLNEKGEELAPPARAMPDWSNNVKEICVKGVVYYHTTYGASATMSPKIIPSNNQFNKPFIEKC